jgi:hypothetical protein
VNNFHTTVGVFIAILLGYLVLTLALGAKRVYFDPFTEKPDQPGGETSSNKEKKENEEIK